MKTLSKLWRHRLWLQLHLQNIRALDRERAQEALSCYTFMGCIGQTGEMDLLKGLGKSYAAARSFAESADFGQALARLGPCELKWESAQIPSPRCRLLVANCSLSALSLIADARIKGWDLVIEDCPFSKRYIAPISSRSRGGLEFRSGHLLRAKQSEMIQSEKPGRSLIVTFCDRPMWTVGDSIEALVAGDRYHFSVVDVLLMVAASEVFVLGRELRRVDIAERVDRSSGLISGETLFHSTTLCSGALSDLIAAAPDRYLGMAQLITRSAKYRASTEKNKKALIRSLLHYCQVSGMSIPAQYYRRLLLDLDAPRNDCKAEPVLN